MYVFFSLFCHPLFYCIDLLLLSFIHYSLLLLLPQTVLFTPVILCHCFYFPLTALPITLFYCFHRTLFLFKSEFHSFLLLLSHTTIVYNYYSLIASTSLLLRYLFYHCQLLLRPPALVIYSYQSLLPLLPPTITVYRLPIIIFTASTFHYL